MVPSRQPATVTSTQQTRVRRNQGVIANRPRGHAANCAPCSTPPVLANIAAFVAKRPPLLVWPPALPWEHNRRCVISLADTRRNPTTSLSSLTSIVLGAVWFRH